MIILKVLVTGAAGFVGFELVKSFLERGFDVVALDKVEGPLKTVQSPKLRVIIGGVEDYETVSTAAEGVDAVCHSAWSFAEKASETFRVDVVGYINVLDACVEHKVKHFLFPDSTVAYGRPLKLPITEDHPLIPEESRAPVYALTRVVTYKLNEIYYKEKGVPFTIFRFWWGYSDERVPGGTLRKLIDSALKGDALEAPREAGGSVLYLGDLIAAFKAAILNERAYGQVFNLSSFYITWKELLEMIVKLSGSSSSIKLVPEQEWRGPAFMTGQWLLDTSKAASVLGVKIDEKISRQKFEQSLIRTIEARKRAALQ